MSGWRATFLLPLLLSACVDARPLSPDFEQRLFSVLGGLAVGEALTLSGESAESIVLQGGEAGARYVFVPFLAAEQGSIRLRIRVQGEQLAAPGAADASLALLATPAREPVMERDDPAAHVRLREWERERAGAFLRSPGARVRTQAAGRVAPAAGAAAALQVGDLVPLRVPNRNPTNTDLCLNAHERIGRVTAVTANAILVEDTLNPIALPAADVQRIADEYERLVHPVAVENFGEPTDLDGNGRVYVFMTSAVNEAAQRSAGGITVGFTFAFDLVPRESGNGLACAASNEGEIFYLIAPDPEARLGVPVSEALLRRLTTSIVVHELQHMINFGRRLYEVEGARAFEELWLNEGLSHIAEELVFYAATGLRPRADIDWKALNGSAPTLDAYRRFVRDNIGIYADYLESPDNESLLGKSARDDDFTTRGAAWAFLRYLADQIPTDDAELFHALVNSPVAGVENLDRVLDTSALSWMQRWTVSNYTENRPPRADVDGKYTQPSWDFKSIYEGEIGSAPLATRTLQPNDTISLTLRGGGSSYIVLRALAGRQARINTTRSAAAVFGELRVSVVRIE